MPLPQPFQRSPRRPPEIPQGVIEIPAPPAAPSANPGSLLAVLLPALMSVVALLATVLTASAGANIAMTLISFGFMGVSALATLVGYFTQRHQTNRAIQDRETKYRALLKQYDQQLAAQSNQQQIALREIDPDPRGCWTRVARLEQVDRRLWERGTADPDFLTVRVGLGTQPFCVTVQAPKQQNPLEADPLVAEAQRLAEQFANVTEAPIPLPLRAAGVAGLAGPRFSVLNAARALAMQIATHHSPDEVKIVALFPADERRDWEWLRWLPHTWTDDRARRLLACDKDTASKLLEQLNALLRRRKTSPTQVGGADAALLPAFVFLLADPRLTENDPILATLLNDAPAVGAFPIFFAERGDKLPRQCQATVELELSQPRMIQTAPVKRELAFQPDEAPLDLADNFARALAPIRLRRNQSAAIPKVIHLLELLGVDTVEHLNLLARWQTSDPSRSLAVPIGKRAGDEPLWLDLHERGHGPHGLAAGKSGSGKSEMLQSLVAALAVHFHPHEVAFVLVDYKGGGMANAFRALPHLIGTITNLQGGLALRALASLRAELQRRQRLFDQANVNHIDAYQRAYRHAQVKEPLPHLIMIVDEFAELKAEQPDFMRELVSAVRVGRSLGVHLLLATQKPAGVVDEQIWANSHFRVCLSVERPEDSHEVLKRPDAASLTRPGSAFLEVGNNEIFELFQAAWGGAPYSPGGAVAANPNEVLEIALDGSRRPLRLSPQPTVIQAGGTELQALVTHIAEVAAQANLPRLRGPWLPPLPEALPLATLRPAEGWNGQTWVAPHSWLAPVIGLADNPALQTQDPLAINLGKEGHLAIYGAPGVGKTTLLQTLILSLAQTHSPDEVNLYLLDFGGRLLTLFAPLPHVGGVLVADEAERLSRLWRFLLRELETRKTLFSGSGVSTLHSFRRSAGNPLRALVVVLDNYTNFVNTYPDAESPLAQIAREGGNLGIHLVLTGTHPNAIRAQVGSNIGMAIALQLTDPGDYTTAVGRTGGLTPAAIPGRGLVKGMPPLEFQTALPVAGDTEAERTAALKAVIEQMRCAWQGKPAQPVPMLPDVVPLVSILPARTAWLPAPSDGALAVPLGLDVDELEPIRVDLNEGPHFIIAGSIQSGKTTAVQSWALALAETFAPSRLQLYFVDFHRTSFGAFARLPHARALIEDDDQFGRALAEISEILRERRATFEQARHAAGGTLDSSWLAQSPALVLVLDNFDALKDGLQGGTKERLDQLVRRERGLGLHVLAAGSASDWNSLPYDCNWGKALKEMQNGFLLGTSEHSDLSLFNLRLPLGDAGKPIPPGQGFYARRGKPPRKIKLATSQAGLNAWIEKIRQRGNV